MEVRLHHSVDEFRAVAEPLYRRDPVAHTVELTVLRAGGLPENSVLLSVWDDGVPVGVAIQTPPYPLSCNGIPFDALDVAAAELARVHPELGSVRGARNIALAFAEAWRSVTGRPGAVTLEERLYRLGRLQTPCGVAGGPRGAVDDRELLVDWVELFFGETFGDARDDDAGERFIDAAKQKGDRFVLWVVGAVPVSMAMLRAPASNVSRIGPVFTPGAHRGHGYGSAVTAAAADLAHRSGTADVVLFADLANPVSNSIYQRIGFEPVVDSVRIDFVTVE